MANLTRPIFLLTDFGLDGHYVGQMRAVIAAIAPACPIHDLSHGVEPFAVDEGAWLLETALPVLPGDAVVVAIVDPGVGTSRRPLVAQSAGRTFIGPDNGLLSGVVDPGPGRGPLGQRHVPLRRSAGPLSEGEQATISDVTGLDVRELTEPSLIRPQVSNTFHGRDIFAPAAAHIAGGADYRRAGPPCSKVLLLPEFCARPAGTGLLEAEVIHIDRYGNLVTTVRAGQLFPRFALEIAGTVIDDHVRTFATMAPGTPFCHVDSSGYLAVAMNRGNAAERLNATRGMPVQVRAR